ncbi:hypothetical protein CGRA01v4_12882 [Colletotrichum graminicola]|nr:hypothetical protein CGRA01v4_12882 [Colletotrichum graminicola]
MSQTAAAAAAIAALGSSHDLRHTLTPNVRRLSLTPAPFCPLWHAAGPVPVASPLAGALTMIFPPLTTM